MRTAKLRPRECKNVPATPWCADYRENGKRVRKYFKTKTLAQAELDRVKTIRRNEGENSLKLTDGQRVEAFECFRRLAEYNESLTSAVDFLISHIQSTKKAVTVRELADEYLEEQRLNKRTDVHRKDLKNRYDKFCQTFGERLVNAISGDEIKGWLRGLGVGPVSFNNYKERLTFLFNFAIEQEYLSKDKNPLAKIKALDEPDELVEILPIDQTAKLLEQASILRPELLPVLVIAAFAGVRIEEIMKLRWEAVNFQTGNLEIMGKISKSKATRTIEMQPNLCEWLAPYVGSTGKIWNLSDNVFNHRSVPVRRAAGIQAWPHNCLHHSFASFHYAKFKNMGNLMNDLGHTSPEMIIKHYKRVQLTAEGEKYFNIRPPTPATNIVQISAAA